MTKATRLPWLVLFAGALLAACERTSNSHLSQRGYLWQRDWTTAVEKAFRDAESRLDGVSILGGEIVWNEARPRLIKSSINWELVAQSRKGIVLALRIAPYPGPFADEDANGQFIAHTAASLLAEGVRRGATISQLQLDFDCAQKKLAGYACWLRTVKKAAANVSLGITALPSWLDEQAFRGVLGEVDDYVLQVHSIPAHDTDGAAVLCDPRLARAAVEKAARLGRPFSIALPTYRCLGGYDEAGRLLGVAMDAVQPAWPGGTRVLEFASDPVALAGLVRQWGRAHPALMRGLVWYRVPTDADTRNWRWPTLEAVMQGREPTHKIEVVAGLENPVDLTLRNSGEAEERFRGSVVASWQDADLVAADGVAGWEVTRAARKATFATTGEDALRLLPGEQRAIGWLRYDRPVHPELALAPTSTR